MPYFFDPGTFVFRGSYWAEDSVIPLPLEGRFTAIGNSESLTIEGTWQQHSGRPVFPFKIELSSKGLDGFLGRVTAHLASRKLNGWVATIPDGVTAVARDEGGGCASIQTQRTKPNVHIAQGLFLASADKPASFTFMIGPFDPEVALENVVSLRGGKRA